MPTEQRSPADAIVKALQERSANRAFNNGSTEAAPVNADAASLMPLFGLIAQPASRPQAPPLVRHANRRSDQRLGSKEHPHQPQQGAAAGGTVASTSSFDWQLIAAVPGGPHPALKPCCRSESSHLMSI